MTTSIEGLIKIGKTATSNFESRMYELEHTGYRNANYLKRVFAIEVEDYDEKEKLLHRVFGRAQVANVELFAADVDTVVGLLSAFEGRQIYPPDESKEEVFEQAAQNAGKRTYNEIPDGTYTLERKVQRAGGKKFRATMEVIGGRYVVLAGAEVCMTEAPGLSDTVRGKRERHVSESGISTDDVTFESTSAAASFVIGGACDGWAVWRDAQGRKIDVYRLKEE